eukprot:5248762-Pleurochrysis_carterae.AAC.6
MACRCLYKTMSRALLHSIPLKREESSREVQPPPLLHVNSLPPCASAHAQTRARTAAARAYVSSAARTLVRMLQNHQRAQQACTNSSDAARPASVRVHRAMKWGVSVVRACAAQAWRSQQLEELRIVEAALRRRLAEEARAFVKASH